MQRRSQDRLLDRRHFLHGAAAIAASTAFGCSHTIHQSPTGTAPSLPFYDAYTPLVPIRAHADRIFRITVCLRPFRAAGPRLDVEKIGDKTFVHNYGHGGSGWSLSWGSAAVAVSNAMPIATTQAAPASNPPVAVLGAGALGLTAATLLQRAGAKVTIYARETAPYTRSSRATGSWTPSSRIALTSAMAPDFAAKWESMARASFFYYQSFLGMPGSPIEWTDRYLLSDRERPPTPGTNPPGEPPKHDFAHLDSRITDLTPRPQLMPAGSTPFPTETVSRVTSMSFNVADYSRQLLTDFLIAGGKLQTREFHSVQELSMLPESVIVNCSGYGARALWSDESIIPVRGQIAWLIPQEGAHYGLVYKGLNMLARRDGIVMQYSKGGEDEGWNDSSEAPDRPFAEEGVAVLAELYSRMQSTSRKHKA
jgi:glycine/D-amino acid oxidase-like deaminating enzyme